MQIPDIFEVSLLTSNKAQQKAMHVSEHQIPCFYQLQTTKTKCREHTQLAMLALQMCVHLTLATLLYTLQKQEVVVKYMQLISMTTVSDNKHIHRDF